MRRGVICLLLMFAGATPAGAPEVPTSGSAGIQQSTTGWCSPAESGNGNTIICNNIDPRALERLNEVLDRKDLDLKQKTDEANEWAQRYNQLNAQLEATKKQLAASGEDATQVQTAQDLLHQGKLGDAREIFDNLVLGTARATVDGRRSALVVASRREDPPKWAAAQNDLGNALEALAQLEQGTKSIDSVREAISAYRLALEERTRERAPLDWARTQAELGRAFELFAIREPGEAKLEDAAAAYREALGVINAGNSPKEAADIERRLAGVLSQIEKQRLSRQLGEWLSTRSRTQIILITSGLALGLWFIVLLTLYIFNPSRLVLWNETFSGSDIIEKSVATLDKITFGISIVKLGQPRLQFYFLVPVIEP